MPSAQPSKSQSNRNVKRAVAQKSITKSPSAKRSTSTNQSGWEEVREFFDDAESKLEKFGERIDKATDKMEKGAEKKLQQTQAWLRDQAKNLKATERKIEQLFDTARVKAHLGKMDATEAAEEMRQRVD